MEGFADIGYWVACVVMGLGIGADVSAATLAMSRVIAPDTARLWRTRITATHIIFPMIGYYGFVWLARWFPQYQLVLGVFAVLAIGWFLLSIWRSLISPDTSGDDQPQEENWFGWSLVLAVSFDALYSGPAKSAQAVGWNATQVLVSFFVAGAVVWLVAYVSTQVALSWKERAEASRDSGFTTILLLFAELAILGYFMWLALLRYVFPTDISDPTIGGISFVVTIVMMLLFRKQVLLHTKSQAPSAR